MDWKLKRRRRRCICQIGHKHGRKMVGEEDPLKVLGFLTMQLQLFFVLQKRETLCSAFANEILPSPLWPVLNFSSFEMKPSVNVIYVFIQL